MRAAIDRSGCIGCGLCAGLCPAVFRMDDEGLAEVFARPRKKDEAQASQAAESCPAGVIRVEE